MNKYTVIGGNGFIGKEVVHIIKSHGHQVFVPNKNDNSLFTNELGIVIYCAGYGDCSQNPLKVLDSNTSLLAKVLEFSHYEKLIYISSTRVYMSNLESSENSNLTINNNDSRKLFNLTKLISEEICILSKQNVIIVRPSNVYGLAISSPLFLPSITRDAILKSIVNMHVAQDYSKDYVLVNDVATAIYKLSQKNNLKNKIYNIASGENTTALEIAKILEEETDCLISWHQQNSADDTFPITDISLIKEEINFEPRLIKDMLKIMINDYKNYFGK